MRLCTRTRRLAAAALGAALGGIALAQAAAAGSNRASTPDLFGMTELAPGLYLDDPAALARVRALIAGAERRTADFFGPLRADPIWVVCTGEACRDALALRSNGLSVGAAVLLIGPGGLNPVVMAHERVHAELHRYLGPRDIVRPRFPAWFDEGLAAHLSGDTRLVRPADPRDADWIRAAGRLAEWNGLRGAHDWRVRYGAAARLVAEIEERAGRDGLLRLIEDVGEGRVPFGIAYDRLVPR